MMQRKRKRSVLPLILGRILELVAGYPEASAAAIHHQLEEEAESGNAGFKGDDVPSVRTVQSIVSEYRQRGPSDPWSLAMAQGDEAKLVMPVLEELIEQTEGRAWQLTTDEARWIAAIRRVAHDLDLWQVYLLAREYAILNGRGESTGGADAYLAFAPWRSVEAARRYFGAMANDRIPDRLMQGPEVLAELKKEDADGTPER